MDWTALKTQIEQSLTDGSWKDQEFEVDGHRTRKNSLAEMRNFYEWVCQKESIADGTSPIAANGYVVPLRNLGSGLS